LQSIPLLVWIFGFLAIFDQKAIWVYLLLTFFILFLELPVLNLIFISKLKKHVSKKIVTKYLNLLFWTNAILILLEFIYTCLFIIFGANNIVYFTWIMSGLVYTGLSAIFIMYAQINTDLKRNEKKYWAY
jgi:hypothetical protein